MFKISQKYYNTALEATVAGLLVNIFLLHSPFVGVPLSVCFVFLTALTSTSLLNQKNARLSFRNIFDGGIFTATVWILCGTAVYYAWQFTTEVFLLFLFLTSATSLYVMNKRKEIQVIFPLEKYASRSFLLVTAITLFFLASLFLLLKHSTTDAIRSPWEVVPGIFFFFLGLMVAGIAALHFSKEKNASAKVTALATLFLTLSVAALVYSIGFGFDPFIHEAAIKEIVMSGVVTPKTPYYIGAYVGILSLVSSTTLPLHLVSRFAGSIVGTMALGNLGMLFPFGILLTVIAPLSQFTITTPQGLAYALSLFSLSYCLRASKKPSSWILAGVCALTALVVHPLAGVPICLVVLILRIGDVEHTRITEDAPACQSSAGRPPPRRRRNGLSVAIIFLFTALFFFPIISFFSQSALDPHLRLHGFRQTSVAIVHAVVQTPETATFSGTRTLLYAARALFPFVIVGLAACALFISDERKKQRLLLFISAILIALGGISQALFVELKNIIGYEALIFPLRFVTVAWIFLLPLTIETLSVGIQKIQQRIFGRVLVVTLVSLTVIAATYLAYPRIDPENKSGGRNVSLATVKAVEKIHGLDAAENSVVLANQTAAAAEIWQYGFSKYVKGKFYYSQPSGSLGLYHYYLEAAENGPSRELMQRVMNEYDVDTVYFVLHDYWKNFPTLAREAKKTADATYIIDNGKVMIFEYRSY